MALTKIDTYEVMYSANTFSPRIWLVGGGRWIGTLMFQPNGSALPPDRLSGSAAILYYYLDHYPNVIDLLRNESPMYLLYSGSGGGFENGIKTTAEMVGEGES